MAYKTAEEVAAAFRANEIDLDTMQAELARINRKPCGLDVGDKGWLKINFDGFRFPVNMAFEQANELFSDEGVARVREFLRGNKSRFKVKAA